MHRVVLGCELALSSFVWGATPETQTHVPTQTPFVCLVDLVKQKMWPLSTELQGKKLKIRDGKSYVVSAFLGRGGTGGVVEVFEDLPTVRRIRVAKVLHRGVEVEAFENEVNVYRAIHGTPLQKHTAELVEAGQTEDLDRPIFILKPFRQPYRDYGDVLAERGAIPEKEALEILSQMLHIVGELHALNLVHRDLKPSQFMETPDGMKLMDFGLARPVNYVEEFGSLVGTPSYMSAAQVNGQPVTPRFDLYSLGVIAFEMTQQTQPFSGDTSDVLNQAIQYQRNQMARPPMIDVSPEFIRIVDRLMPQDQTEQPFNSAAEAERAVRELLGRTPTSTQQTKPDQPSGRHRISVPAGH